MIRNIYIHHTAVSYKKNPNQAPQTNEYHKTAIDENGNSKFHNGEPSSLNYWIGYTYEMNANGEIIQARKDGEEQAAQRGYNKESISIALDMDGDVEYPTNAQLLSLRNFLREKMTEYKLTFDDVKFHRDVALYKSCPGLQITRNRLFSDLFKL